MEALTLHVTHKGFKDAKSARAAGQIPIVSYGKGVKNLQFSADYNEFVKVYKKGGRSTIVQFEDEDKKLYPVLVHDIQYHPVTDDIQHVDVLAVDMNKKIHAEIALIFKGIAPAVKELAGVLVKSKESIKVECFPKDLVQSIEVDISSLIDFHSVITVANLTIPESIKVLDNPAVAVIKAVPPKEEETAAPVTAAAPVEGAAAPAEGAAPAAAAPAEAAAKPEKAKK